jgi:biotin carboxyl carrier protein
MEKGGGYQVKRTIRFQLDGQIYEVEIERDGDRLTVTRDGESFTVNLLGPAAAGPASGASEPAHAPQAAAPATPVPAPRAVPAQPGGTQPGGAGLLRAPMTGLVKEVKVAAGSRVAKGEVVVVMEAMKMDVEVSAPASGVVAEVRVSAGQSVEAQAPLLSIRG